MSDSKIKSDEQIKKRNSNSKSRYYNSEENKREVKHLSNYISPRERELFITNNKKALKCYQKLINTQKKINIRKHNNILSPRENNTNYNMHSVNSLTERKNLSSNPKLLLKTFDKNLLDRCYSSIDQKNIDNNNINFGTKVKFIGVEEGLISLPTNFSNFQLKNQKSKLNLSNHNSYDNQIIKNINNSDEDIKENTKEKYAFSEEKKLNKNLLSSENILHQKIKQTELQRGEEYITYNKPKNIPYKKNEKFKKRLSVKLKELQQKFQRQLKYNYELRRLDNWDFENLSLKKSKFNNELKKNYIIDGDNSKMEWLIKIKNDKEQLKNVSRNKHLSNFFNSFGKEQQVILTQTMKNIKKGFNFDVFSKSKEELNIMKENENDEMTGVNYYRSVMKAKLKVEEMFLYELSNCAEQVKKSKIQKQKTVIFSYELLNKYEELEKKEFLIHEKYKDNLKNKNNHRHSIDKKKETIFRKYSIVNSNDNSSEKKRISNFSKKLIESNLYSQLCQIHKEKNELEKKIKNVSSQIEICTLKHKKAKTNLTEKIRILAGYYYQILKKGIDVRRSGLSWVIVKLMELNAFIDKPHFPNFLDDEQIEYILKIGIRTFELNELVKLFQLLKEKQKKLKEKHVKEDKDKEDKKKYEKIEKLKEKQKNTKYFIGDDYMDYIGEVQRKYENVIQICLNEKTEEQNINKISNGIKKQILLMNNEEISEIKNKNIYERYFIPGSLAEYFSKDKRFRQYFDDIYYLNEEINERRIKLKELKEKALKKFKSKTEIKFLNKNKKIIKDNDNEENEMIRAALFGNGISI